MGISISITPLRRGKNTDAINLLTNKVNQLEQDNREIKKELEQQNVRNLNANIELSYNDGVDPFSRERLELIDVSGNIYVVESKVLEQYQKALYLACEKLSEEYINFIEKMYCETEDVELVTKTNYKNYLNKAKEELQKGE